MDRKKKGGPSSQIDRSELPNDLEKLYHDLSSDSEEDDVCDELDKLKTLFKGNTLINIER